MQTTVAVLGASANREKYGNKAVRAFLDAGYTVYPINLREKEIEGLQVFQNLQEVPQPITFVSVYLPPEVGRLLADDIAACKPQEVYLNPGAEDRQLAERLATTGVRVIERCSIRTHGKDPNDYPA